MLFLRQLAWRNPEHVPSGNRPYKICVVDKDTSEAVLEFWFQYEAKTHKIPEAYEQLKWQAIKAPDGSITIQQGVGSGVGPVRTTK